MVSALVCQFSVLICASESSPCHSALSHHKEIAEGDGTRLIPNRAHHGPFCQAKMRS